MANGWDFLVLSNQCQPICGDNLIYGTEECDDGNLIPFDGCFNCKFQCDKNCKICEFGRCVQCFFGYDQKSQYFHPVCGDALTLDHEVCNDGNIEQFDGCYKCNNSCQIEFRLCVNQLCFQCQDGWQLIGNQCQQVCNDNLLAILSIEQFDNDDDSYCSECVQLCQDNCISCHTYNKIYAILVPISFEIMSGYLYQISLAPILDFLKIDYFLSKLNGGIVLCLQKKMYIVS
ncbi:unnamed protein product [Paramecium octaurelia]|uniref:Uncharacterized protein n=1 Tax=Paramecium octaurelia TaxID=43137 RepID=A0A8S1X2I8_PAROT|nr:unnamed protein product [Paramecium octaurelia]